jgi:hypothetical protein
LLSKKPNQDSRREERKLVYGGRERRGEERERGRKEIHATS